MLQVLPLNYSSDVGWFWLRNPSLHLLSCGSHGREWGDFLDKKGCNKTMIKRFESQEKNASHTGWCSLISILRLECNVHLGWLTNPDTEVLGWQWQKLPIKDSPFCAHFRPNPGKRKPFNFPPRLKIVRTSVFLYLGRGVFRRMCELMCGCANSLK